MTTYRALFANGEFRALFAGNAATVAGGTMQGLALSALIYATTGSPLLSALAFAGALFPQAIGAMTLLSLTDRLRPRAFLAGWTLVKAAVAAVFALGALPPWGMLALLMAVGVVDSITGGMRAGIIVDIAPGNFVLGRSVLNVSVGLMQILGFATGGLVITALGPGRALAVAAALTAISALFFRFGLADRPPRGTGRAGIRATWHANKSLLGDPVTRPLLLGAWLPNGLIVGAEAMYVPYAGNHAAVLFVAAALGMLTGDVVVGRWVPAAQRARQVNALQALLALPYLFFFLTPSVWVGAALVAVASFGYSGTLGLQQRLVDAIPEGIRGQALGLDSSGRMTFQAVGAFVVGLIAEVAGAPGAMTLAAMASLLVSAMLWRPLRSHFTTGAPTAVAVGVGAGVGVGVGRS
ncbi:MFS transporter [Actinoplanes sp. CA-142083]|uniref:MFS transporter n=1 Tax=Actinoplanes sp. CA-142083 TaxID=3239903 RepID=UPI003D8C97F5